jgi:hypothetical protein
MPSQHERAVEAALRTNDELKKLFNRMGNSEHPRGRILAIFRVNRLALAQAWGNARAMLEVLSELRRALRGEAEELIALAVALGEAQAEREFSIYGLSGNTTADRESGLAATGWQAAWEAQANQVEALIRGGVLDRGLILGDGTRVGLLSPGRVLVEGAQWLALAAVSRHAALAQAALDRDGRAERYMRQAIAAIDERTTNCCLRVHGQVVALDEPFKLTGTPRYADEMLAPPFHRYCRTATALVLAGEAEDGLTAQMQRAARAELQARGPDDVRQRISPADARSARRGQG